MSVSGTMLFAWAGVYLYVSAYYGLLYLYRREYREHLYFAGLTFCLAVFAAASAWSVDTRDAAECALAQRLQVATLLPAFGLFTDFTLRLADEERPRLVAALHIFFITGAALGAIGLLNDPAVTDASYDWARPSSTNRALPALTLSALTLLVVGSGACLFGLYRLFARATPKRELRGVAILATLGVVGGIYDVVARLSDLPAIHLSTHAALLPVLGLSYALVGRFARVDEQLADRTEELEESHDHLRHAQEELVRKEQLAAVGELSAVIAHELRNPLAIVKNAVSGLGRARLTAEDRTTLLSILDEETDRLARLVQDLLSYARPITPELKKLDLPQLVMHAVELAAAGNRSTKGVELELDLERETIPIDGDEALLRHALINIVDNALQAMPSGGALTIRCLDTDLDGHPAVAVEFDDTGEGMDTLVRSRATDPFFTTRQSSSGLGLAIVNRVARAHGGRVDIESRHGEGTTVRLVIPVERTSKLPTFS